MIMFPKKQNNRTNLNTFFNLIKVYLKFKTLEIYGSAAQRDICGYRAVTPRIWRFSKNENIIPFFAV